MKKTLKMWAIDPKTKKTAADTPTAKHPGRYAIVYNPRNGTKPTGK